MTIGDKIKKIRTFRNMTIKTYDYNGNKYADDFTITKTTDAQSAGAA